MLLADVNLGELLWTTFVWFLIIMWFIILWQILTDLFRDQDESGGAKAVWVIFLILIPFLSALVYLIVRGQGMSQRSLAHAADRQRQFNDYVQNVAADTSPTAQIANAKQLLDSGAITQAEFDALKAKALG